MITALMLIVIILLGSGSLLWQRRHFRKKLKPHMDALERASKRNAGLEITTK